MTPVLPNPPPSPFDKLLDRKDHHDFQQFDHNHHHHHLCLSSHDNQLSCDDQRLIQFQASQQQHQFKVDQYSSHHRSSEVQVFSSSSSHQANINNGCKREVIGDGSSTSENGSSPKWMPSKIRLMQKMMNTNCTSTRTTESEKIMKKLEYQFQESNEIINSLNNNKSTVRVCSDCNTTTTPLWRSGPRGPKTLCNACGIRQRKVRRAMEAAAAAGNATTAVTIDTGSTKIKIQHNKEKKSRTSHTVGQYKKQCKPQDPPADQIISQRNLCFKDFALSLSKNSSALKQVFPQDVEEAAILLMELSCGFIQS